MTMCNESDDKDMDEKQRKIQSLLTDISMLHVKEENLKSYIYKSIHELDLKMLKIISSETDNYLQGLKDAFEDVLKKIFGFKTITFVAKESKENKETLQDVERGKN